MPELETTLPLLLTTMKQDKITLEQIIDKYHTAPTKIFNLPTNNTTYIKIKPIKYKIHNKNLHTKYN